MIWYRKAAAQGDANAQYALGRAYADSQGASPQDYKQAVTYYKMAAAQGLVLAQAELGNLYAKGQGVAQDYTEAVNWYRKAANQGVAAAQEKLGELYLAGRGTAQDYAEAYFWFDLAAAGKIEGTKQEDVAQKRDDAASHLGQPQVLQVQDRARKWFAAHAPQP
jgi:TPR repeat protein